MPTVKRNILLNPGPATTTDSVKAAQVVPDICPREKEFGGLMGEICRELTLVVADDARYTAVLFGGSGTAAVEAMISSVVGDGTLVIVNNGAYGKRMCEIAAAYRLNYVEFRSAPDDPLDLQALDRLMAGVGAVSHLAVVHHETTTGLLNDVAAIGQLCRRHKTDLIVDAMSSYAAVPIRMEEMNIRYLAASSNKNLQAMAGVSFVIADKSRLETAERPPKRNFYLDIYEQHRSFVQSGQMRFTPPVQTIYALKQAIDELKREGVEARYRRYVKSWETLIAGLRRLGLRHLVAEPHHSKLVTSVLEPSCSGYDFYEMHDYFYERGYTIYPGKLERLHTFRIANIGDIDYKDIEAFLILLEQYLDAIGHPHGKADEYGDPD